MSTPCTVWGWVSWGSPPFSTASNVFWGNIFHDFLPITFSRHGKKLFGALVEEGYLVVLIDRDGDGLRLIAQDGIDVFLGIPRIFLGIGDGERFVDGFFTVNLLTSTGKTRNPISCAMLQM